MTLAIFGYASSIAANESGSELAPDTVESYLYKHPLTLPFHWKRTFTTDSTATGEKAESAVHQLCADLAQGVFQSIKAGDTFLTIGGDHSCAIGTWSGAAEAIEGDLGLIWVDAHLDSHTPETTHTQNIHGMPVAVLLGHGHDALAALLSSTPKLKPENLCMIGIRSYEPEERELLERLGITIFDMTKIEKEGLSAIMQKALEAITKHTSGFGISIDVDSIDPKEAPGVSVPEENGLRAEALIKSLAAVHQFPHFIGAEIAELNPERDKSNKSLNIVIKLINALFQ